VHLRFDAGRELEAGAALNASRFEAQGLSPASRERIRVGSHMQHTGGF